MGSSDIPPDHAPSWLVPLHMALLGVGVIFWDATYILMTRRALATKAYGMPLLALVINVSWELVTVFYVCEAWLETVGFFIWLVLDLGLIYTTIKFAPNMWARSNRWVGRHMGWIFTIMTAVGCLGQYAFASWWLKEPGMGSGVKDGKWWFGKEGYDTTELAFWSAGFAQIVASVTSISMLLTRGHSGGVSYSIWFCRTVGSISGLVLCNLVMWWYWPEAHGFIVSPFAVFLWGTSIACDIVYPFLLYQVRHSESARASEKSASPGSHVDRRLDKDARRKDE